MTSKENSQDSVLRHFLFSSSVTYLMISSSLMVLNSTNMPTTPKLMSIAQISPLNFGLINLTDDFVSPLRDKYLRHNTSKIKFLIFSMKVVHLTIFSMAVIGNSISPATRARNIKLILDHLLTPYVQLLTTFYWLYPQNILSIDHFSPPLLLLPWPKPASFVT